MEVSESEPPRQAAEPPPVRIMLFAFLFMFQGYGVMVGNPQKVLRDKLDISHDNAGAFQNACASFQLTKLVMRVAQIAFLAVLPPKGIVYVAYLIMFSAVSVPVVFVFWLEEKGLWIVYLQYCLGGIAIGLFEGTFLSVISPLGKRTKTFVIMGAPLGFAVHNVPLGLFEQWGMPPVTYYLYTLCCLPAALVIFYLHAPMLDPIRGGKGCQAFLHSLKRPCEWLPYMLPWFGAKFVGNFVLEDAFPLLFNTFNTQWVPLFGGPASESFLVPIQYYLSCYWFVMMAIGDTVSRRVPQHIPCTSPAMPCCVLLAIVGCVVGQSLNYFLQALVAGIAVFIANFGNGFIYGYSAKFIDTCISEEHRYAAYNLWCFCGDLGGYLGQSSFSVGIAEHVCAGKHYKYVCANKEATAAAAPKAPALGEPAAGEQLLVM